MEELKMPPTKAQRPHCIGPENGLLFKLRFQNSENFVHGVLFEVGFLVYSLFYFELFSRSSHDSLIALAICMMLTGLVGYFSAEMLLNKTIRSEEHTSELQSH